MTRAIITSAPLNALIVVALLAIPAAVPAAAADYYRSVGGIAIYIRVLPAAMVQAHAPEHPEATMHGGTPAWGEQYHVAIALFDRLSGKRIRDARIKATAFDMRRPGNRLPGPHNELQPMLTAGEASYGNYLNTPAPAPFRVELEIRRPGESRVARASVEYQHAVVTTKPHA
ncbi:MAG: hypothetical protein HYY78_02815 [Betaproteobacteria bacterium]|nr:hypothetical protein [Betaproteobacteria bacterium]